MVRLHSNVVNGAVHRSLRLSSALSYGSLAFPHDSAVSWPPHRARRVPRLKQWFVQREEFEAKVQNEYLSISPGEAKQLVAGTGVGKSTKLPVLIAGTHSVSGIVLMPSNLMVMSTLSYLKIYPSDNTVTVALLRSMHGTSPIASPCVYYATAADFLGRLAVNPSLLADLGLDFIFLDESHENRPDYKFFEYLTQTPTFNAVRVFFGTATAADDVSMEAGSIGRTVKPCPIEYFALSDPDVISPRSPLHYTQIQNRTLIIMNTDAQIDKWAAYYDRHDIACQKQSMSQPSSDFVGVYSFLDSNPLCVVLGTQMHQSSITLNIDSVVDCGYETHMKCDFVTAKVSLELRPVTMAVRVQRAGRVARFKPGTAYHPDIEPSPTQYEYTQEQAFYIYLWSRVFNMKISEPTIADFAQLTGDLSVKAAAMLLHSRIYPFLLLPYVDDNGFYAGWGGTMRNALYSNMRLDSLESNQSKVLDWAEHSTGPIDYADAPIKFKTRVEFPKEMSVLPAVAWVAYSEEYDVSGLVGLSGRSVVSHASTRARGASVHSSDSVAVAGQNSRLSPPPYVSRTTIVERPRSGIVVPSIRELHAAYSYQSVVNIPDQGDDPGVVPIIHATRPVIGDPPTAERIADWRANVPTSPVRLVSGRSASSDEQHHFTVKQVDPMKHKYLKFYPLDTALCAEFVNNESYSGRDSHRVTNLISGRRNFSSLHPDLSLKVTKQGEYFLSVIRSHNHAVMQKLQLQASSSRSLFDKLSTRSDIGVYERTIVATCALLRACEHERFYVGVDGRSFHASSDGGITPVYDQYQYRAKMMLAFGDPEVVCDVETYARASCPVLKDGKCVANAWHFHGFIVGVRHAFINVVHPNAVVLHHKAEDITTWDDYDLVVFEAKTESSVHPKFRKAVSGESVIVLLHDTNSGTAIAVGDFTVTGNDNPLFMDFLFERGCSGALVIAVTDGCILGMYVGMYSEGVANVTPTNILRRIFI